MVEVDAAVLHLFHRVFRVVQVRGFLQNLTDPSDAGQGNADHHHYHGDHHQAHQHGHDVAEEACQVTGGKGATHDEVGAQPGNRDDAEIHSDHHRRCIHRKDALCLHKHLVQCGRGLGELGVLIILPDKRLYHADGGDVFLDAGVQIIVPTEHLIKDFQRHCHNNRQYNRQEGYCNQKHSAQMRVDDQTHNEAENQRERSTGCHPNHHHKCILYICDICSHPCNQAGYTKLINVREGKCLDIGINRFP